MSETNILALTAAIYIVTQINTNWVSVPSRRMSLDGTNYVSQWMHSVETNTVREEVTPIVIYHTNRTVIGHSSKLLDPAKAPTRWMQTGPPPLPPTPGQQTKL